MARPDIFYLKPNSNWAQSNARFAAYFCHGAEGISDIWVNAVGPNEDGVYSITHPTEVVDEEITKPIEYATIIFCRMNPSTEENNWDNTWNQTSDLTIPTDDTNLYTIEEGSWSKGNGSWSTYDPNAPKTYSVTLTVGYGYYEHGTDGYNTEGKTKTIEGVAKGENVVFNILKDVMVGGENNLWDVDPFIRKTDTNQPWDLFAQEEWELATEQYSAHQVVTIKNVTKNLNLRIDCKMWSKGLYLRGIGGEWNDVREWRTTQIDTQKNKFIELSGTQEVKFCKITYSWDDQEGTVPFMSVSPYTYTDYAENWVDVNSVEGTMMLLNNYESGDNITITINDTDYPKYRIYLDNSDTINGEYIIKQAYPVVYKLSNFTSTNNDNAYMFDTNYSTTLTPISEDVENISIDILLDDVTTDGVYESWDDNGSCIVDIPVSELTNINKLTIKASCRAKAFTESSNIILNNGVKALYPRTSTSNVYNELGDSLDTLLAQKSLKLYQHYVRINTYPKEGGGPVSSDRATIKLVILNTTPIEITKENLIDNVIKDYEFINVGWWGDEIIKWVFVQSSSGVFTIQAISKNGTLDFTAENTTVTDIVVPL